MSFIEWVRTDGLKAACLSLLCLSLSIEVGYSKEISTLSGAVLFWTVYQIDTFFETLNKKGKK